MCVEMPLDLDLTLSESHSGQILSTTGSQRLHVPIMIRLQKCHLNLAIAGHRLRMLNLKASVQMSVSKIFSSFMLTYFILHFV